MSASLVGSEMCIRDSPPDPSEKRLRRPAPEAFFWVGVQGGGSSPGKRGCLLYTSDAADDMQV
eukprot:591046-Alexandrium_andersonii.AAC.1